MRHILILRELSEQEIRQINILSGDPEVEITGDPSFTKSLKRSKAHLKLSENEKKKINYRILNEILDFGDTIVSDQCVSSHLQIANAGLWYYHKFRIYFKVRNQQYIVEEIRKNIANETTGEIYVSNSGYLSLLRDLDGYEIYALGKAGKQRLSISSILQYVFAVSIRLFKSIIIPVSKFNKKEVVFIDTVNQYRKMLSLDGSSTIFENAYLGYLFQKKGEELAFIDQLILPKFKGVDRYRFQPSHIKNSNKRMRLFGERIMFAGMFSIRSLRKFLSAKKELNVKYKILKKEIGNDAVKLGYLNELIKLHSSSLFYLFKYFAYSKFFSGKKFKSVFSTDENSPNFKIILEAARQNNIHTVGYQHGSMHDLHPAYIYSKSDMTNNPIPDLTITWGSKWADFLANTGNYPKGKIDIAGQVRTDIIKSMQSNPELNSARIIKNADQKRIILFATQPQRDPALRCRAAEDVVKACKDLDSSHLVFKLHPRETDPEYYEEIAKNLDYEDFTISRNEELYILLYISDVVITCFSTVGSEALYFSKPLIILDHLKQDILNYHKDKVAFQATNSDELNKLIKKVLASELSVDMDVLQKYLEASTYKIDGMVSERVWDLVSTKKHFQN